MRKVSAAVVIGAAVVAGIAVPTAASAQPKEDLNQCKAAVAHAVWEDMDSYNKGDAARYANIIDENDMVTIGYTGLVHSGYHTNVDPVLASFATPTQNRALWDYTVVETHAANCQSGYAVLDAYNYVPSVGVRTHFTLTLTVAKDDGQWKVVKDTITKVL